jgi:hypothetical protein
MMTSRLALCDADHASSTGDIGSCTFCALGDAGARLGDECAMMARVVVAIKFSMRSPNFGSTEHEQRRQIALPCNTDESEFTGNNLGR